MENNVKSRRFFNLLLILVAVSFLSMAPSPKIDWKWSRIKEFRYYGSSNPLKGKTTRFVPVSRFKVWRTFSGAEKSNMHLPIGFSRYAEIIFKDGSVSTIQMIPGAHLTFRVIEKNVLSDDWYKSSKKGGFEYFKSLDAQLE